MNPETLSLMESGFGHDFSRVRVHADAAAARSARALGAHAYTIGEDVVFGAGEYDPTGTAGRRRLAHELAHVVQQDGAGVPARSLSVPSHPSERAAEDAAARVVSGSAASVEPAAAPALVSRDADWSIDPSGGPPPTTNVLQEFDVDRKKGGKAWNLDKLTKQIAEALAASKDRYVEVVGYYDVSEEEGAGDARDAARKRADVVRRALLEWIPTLKGRLRVATRDRDLWRQSGGEPTRRQVGVEWGPFGVVPPGTFDQGVLGGGPIFLPEPLVPKAQPLPEGVPPAGEAEPLVPRPGATATYPGKGLDAFRAFFATPAGQEMKRRILRVAERDWNALSLAEKIGIIASQALPASLLTYGLATMPERDQKAIAALITSDADVNALRPLPEKTWNFGLDVDPDFSPRTLRTPLFDKDLPSKKAPPGGTALGADLRIVKPALKTFFKPGEGIAVAYAVPDAGWWIDVLSEDGKVVEKKTVHATSDGHVTLLAPDTPGLYTLRLVDWDGQDKRRVRFRVQ